MYGHETCNIQFETVSSSSGVSSWGGEFQKPETLARVAPGYSCTNSLPHYLNIRMNTSVVLKELSAHLLVCSYIAVNAACLWAGMCTCDGYSVRAYQWLSVSVSHRATHLQQYLVLVKVQHTCVPRHSFVPSNLMMDELVITQTDEYSRWMFVCVCAHQRGESCAVTRSVLVNCTTDWKWSPSSWAVDRQNSWEV